MPVSRRLFLQQGITALTLGHGGVSPAMLHFLQGSVAAPSHDFVSFGVDEAGRMMDPRSLYRVPGVPSARDRLCFDVSNNRIACSINQRGLIERIAIQCGVVPIEIKSSPVGAYVDKVLARGGPMGLSVSVADGKPVALHELDAPEIHLQEGLFPRFEWKVGAVRLKMLVFAPQTADARPRALFVRFTAASHGMPELPVHVVPQLPQNSDPNAAFLSKLLTGSERGWSRQDTLQPIGVGSTVPTMALLMDTTEEEMEQARHALVAVAPNAWFERTCEYHVARYGELTIPEAPFYAELYVRAAELTRQSLMLDGDGRFGGSFNGSDLPAATNVWMRDCFYSSLPQSMLCPDLARRAISFFLDHGIPSHPLGEHADRFPAAKGVTNSLGNSVAGIVLAGMYYKDNNDRQFFLDHPEILSKSISILQHVLESRREEAFLFPSIYVSDGESRGDFHTGSNIFLWRAFTSFARLAEEVYGLSEETALWRTCAGRLHEAIVTNCIMIEDRGPRFVEGCMQDHTSIGGHDGEESDVTLAAFYNFCSIDDPAFVNAAREATTPANPYAIPELEGIWWYAHGKWSSATFPGWMTALAGARNGAETLRHLERIRTLTDADGSFWWWPYLHSTELHLSNPLRTNSKCGWAAGVYVSLFTRHILGLEADAPGRTLEFSPCVPWSRFEWKNCRMGAIVCDCSYRRTHSEIVLEVRNRTGYILHVSLRGLLPEDTTLLHASILPAEGPEIRQSKSGSSLWIESSVSLKAGENAVLYVSFTG